MSVAAVRVLLVVGVLVALCGPRLVDARSRLFRREDPPAAPAPAPAPAPASTSSSTSSSASESSVSELQAQTTACLQLSSPPRPNTFVRTEQNVLCQHPLSTQKVRLNFVGGGNVARLATRWALFKTMFRITEGTLAVNIQAQAGSMFGEAHCDSATPSIGIGSQAGTAPAHRWFETTTLVHETNHLYGDNHIHHTCAFQNSCQGVADATCIRQVTNALDLAGSMYYTQIGTCTNPNENPLSISDFVGMCRAFTCAIAAAPNSCRQGGGCHFSANCPATLKYDHQANYARLMTPVSDLNLNGNCEHTSFFDFCDGFIDMNWYDRIAFPILENASPTAVQPTPETLTVVRVFRLVDGSFGFVKAAAATMSANPTVPYNVKCISAPATGTVVSMTISCTAAAAPGAQPMCTMTAGGTEYIACIQVPGTAQDGATPTEKGAAVAQADQQQQTPAAAAPAATDPAAAAPATAPPTATV